MDFIEFTGKTVDDALTNALVEFGVTSDQIDYDVLEKGSSGFLDLTVNRQKSKPAKNIPLQITSKISFPRYLLPWDWKLRS